MIIICRDYAYCVSTSPAPTRTTTQSTTHTQSTTTPSSSTKTSTQTTTTTTRPSYMPYHNVVYTTPYHWWYWWTTYPQRSYIPQSQCAAYYGTTALSTLISAYASPVSACPGSTVEVPVTIENKSVHNLSLNVGGTAISLSPYSSSTVHVPVTVPSGYSGTTYSTSISISSLDCQPMSVTANINVVQLNIAASCAVSNASLTSASISCSLSINGTNCYGGAVVNAVDNNGNVLATFSVPTSTISFTVDPANYGCSPSNPSCTLDLSFVYNNTTVGSTTIPIHVTCAVPTNISISGQPYIVILPTTNTVSLSATVSTQVPGLVTVMACTDSSCTNVLFSSSGTSTYQSSGTVTYTTNLSFNVPPNASTIYIMAKDTCNNTALAQLPVYNLSAVAVQNLAVYAPNVAILGNQVTVQVSGNLVVYAFWQEYSVPITVSITSSSGTVVQKAVLITVPASGQPGGKYMPTVATTSGGGGPPFTLTTIPFNAYLTFDLPNTPGTYTYTASASFKGTTMSSTNFTISVVGGLFQITSYSCTQTYPCTTYPNRQVTVSFAVTASQGSGAANVYLYDAYGNLVAQTTVSASTGTTATSSFSFTAPAEPGTYTYYLVVRPSTAGGCPSNLTSNLSGCYPVVINVVPLPVPYVFSITPTSISAVSGSTYTVTVTYGCRGSPCGTVQFNLVDTTSGSVLASTSSTCSCVVSTLREPGTTVATTHSAPCTCQAQLQFTATLPSGAQSYSTELDVEATVAGITYTLSTIPMTVVPPCTPKVSFTPYITGNYDVGLGGVLNIVVTADNTAGCGANVSCMVMAGNTTVGLCNGAPCVASTHVPANAQAQLTMQMQFSTAELGNSYSLVCTYDTTQVTVATIQIPSEYVPVTIYCNGKPMYNNLRLSRAEGATAPSTVSGYVSTCSASTYSGGNLTYNLQLTVANAPASWTATVQLSIPSLNASTTTTISGPSGTSTQQGSVSLAMTNVPPGTYTGQLSIQLSYTYNGITYSSNYVIPVTATVYYPVTVGFINAQYTAYPGQTLDIPVGVCSQVPSLITYKVTDNYGNAYTRTVTLSQSGCVTDYLKYQVVGMSDIDPQLIQAYAEGLQDFLTQVNLNIEVLNATILSSTATAAGKPK